MSSICNDHHKRALSERLMAMASPTKMVRDIHNRLADLHTAAAEGRHMAAKSCPERAT